ncbi:MAG: helix-turn-helix transcriptional regulator [Holophagaceae bacterium]|nr:helix-turn-helix transcriptional regulator [Holophagaceae bacterium]
MEKSLFSAEYTALLGLLREVRESSGISQEQIAQRLGTKQSMISKVERGERRLDVIELRRWVLELGQSFPEFLARFEALVPSGPLAGQKADRTPTFDEIVLSSQARAHLPGTKSNTLRRTAGTMDSLWIAWRQ